MTNKKDGIIRPNDLDYLAKSFSNSGSLTTGDLEDILQISQQTVIRACDDGWLEHTSVPGSKHRRIWIKQLVDSLRKNWNDFNKEYPQRLLLHLMEVLDLNPEDYGLHGVIGKGDIRFHVQEGLYTTGKVADLVTKAQQTIIRNFDSGRIEGYRVLNSDFRRIPAGAVIRYFRGNGIPLDESMSISSPELITYRNIFGNTKDVKGWLGEDNVAYKPNTGQSVWYKSDGKLSEISVRLREDYGLYTKLIETETDKPIIYTILLDKARFDSKGKPLSQDKYTERVAIYLGICESLLKDYPTLNTKDEIERVRNKVHNRFLQVFTIKSS